MTKILVVEDEPGIAAGLEDDLRLEGYEVELVGDGVLASRRAREAQFDLILLDVMLPGKDGFDVCRDLRAGLKNTGHTPHGKDAGGREDSGAGSRGGRLCYQALQSKGTSRAHPGCLAQEHL